MFLSLQSCLSLVFQKYIIKNNSFIKISLQSLEQLIHKMREDLKAVMEQSKVLKKSITKLASEEFKFPVEEFEIFKDFLVRLAQDPTFKANLVSCT